MQNPSKMKKAQMEVDSALGGKKITLECLKKMEYVILLLVIIKIQSRQICYLFCGMHNTWIKNDSFFFLFETNLLFISSNFVYKMVS